MPHILQTDSVHKIASLADEGNSAYFQSGAHNIKHIFKLKCKHMYTASRRRLLDIRLFCDLLHY